MSTKLYVLIVEDTEDDALLLLRELRKGGYDPVFERVQTRDDFTRALDRGGWDIIIADYSMPQFTGFDALAALRKTGRDIPFLLVSGTIGEDLAVEAMKAGAQDYLVKGKLARLIPTIQRELREVVERRERRNAERELRQTHAYLQSIIEASPIAIVVLDADLLVRVLSPAAERLFGWSAGEALGQPLPFDDDESSKGLADLLRAARTGLPIVGAEIQLTNRAGGRLELAVSTAPLSDRDGGLLVFFNDISHSKLIEAQLRQSQKMEAVGQLAGGVAHDFNNLLQVIIGYVAMQLEFSEPSDPRHNDLLEMQAAGNRAMDLTRQLLAFSRRQVLQPKDLNINSLIQNLLKMIRRVIGEHIQLDFIQGHAIGTIHADPGQIEQVLLNLCINARDAMAHGGNLMIETENVNVDGSYAERHPWVPPGRFVLLTVSDTGCGIDEETQNHIFEPFFTTKAEGKGTGLGLATVYGIIKQHNGFIHVYSEIDKGTTFKMYLPIVERRASEVGNKIERAVAGGDEVILIAEDQEGVRTFTARVLSEAGYEVLTASDGEEALAVFREHADRIAMVLLDVIMPKLYGRAVYDQIRQIRPGVRVLFCSGYSANGLHTGFIASENAELLQKPFTPKDLLRKVRQVLDKAS